MNEYLNLKFIKYFHAHPFLKFMIALLIIYFLLCLQFCYTFNFISCNFHLFNQGSKLLQIKYLHRVSL